MYYLLKNFTEGSLKIKDLRCEYAVNPIGIDVQNPRFSWILESGMRAQAQTAFQVIVAKDIESLGKHRGDKWDSGKIMSNNSVNIHYEGGMLMSGEKCFWKVRVWDNEGNVSTWAQPVSFEMGILADNDWGGKWIGNRIFNELNYSEGKTGKAVSLSCIYQAIKARYHILAKLEDGITISAWIKPSNFTNQWQTIYRKDDGFATQLLALGKKSGQNGIWF